MKKLFLSLMVAATAASAFAQKNMAGGILLYGEGTYSSQKGSDHFEGGGISTSIDQPRLIGYTIAPGIGFNVTNNLTVGLNLGYMGSKFDLDKSQLNSGDLYETKSSQYMVGPFVRYTAWMGEHFFAFGQFNVSYVGGKTTDYRLDVQHNEETKSSGVAASLVPAAGFMVNPNLGITFGIGGLGFNYAKTTNDPELNPGGDSYSKNSAFVVTIGQQFNIGVQKYFGCGRGKKGHHEMMGETRHVDTSDDEDDAPKRKKASSDDDE